MEEACLGLQRYWAPEVHRAVAKGETHQKLRAAPLVQWHLGCAVFEILTGSAFLSDATANQQLAADAVDDEAEEDAASLQAMRERHKQWVSVMYADSG